MTKPLKGVINVDTRHSTPDWEPYLQPKAPEGAPNVVYIVLDAAGFSSMEPWGGLIETPNINRLAANGLTYTNWHTTALCSPTRSRETSPSSARASTSASIRLSRSRRTTPGASPYAFTGGTIKRAV